jgi:hypothetical protein
MVMVVYPKNGNYELKFRQIKEESTDGSGSVCHVDFYVISYVLGCSVLVPDAKDQTRSLDAACIVYPSPYTPI